MGSSRQSSSRIPQLADTERLILTFLQDGEQFPTASGGSFGRSLKRGTVYITTAAYAEQGLCRIAPRAHSRGRDGATAPLVPAVGVRPATFRRVATRRASPRRSHVGKWYKTRPCLGAHEGHNREVRCESGAVRHWKDAAATTIGHSRVEQPTTAALRARPTRHQRASTFWRKT